MVIVVIIVIVVIKKNFRYVAAVVRPAAFEPNASSHPLYPMSPAAMQVKMMMKISKR